MAHIVLSGWQRNSVGLVKYACNYVNELCNNSIGNSHDDAVYEKTHEYDSNKATQRLKNTIKTFKTPTETENNHDFEGS